jgi:hypothetical protein
LAGSLATATPALAHEPSGGKIWAYAGPSLYRTRSGHQAAKEAPAKGGGLVAQADVDDNGGVEIGMFYLDKLYVRETDDDVVAERIKRMYITSGYRHWFVPWVSAAAAFFSSYSMGDPKVIVERESEGEDFVTTARDITEYGLDASLQAEVWGAGDAAVVLDARYSLSLTDKPDESADVASVLLGYKHRVPSRR